MKKKIILILSIFFLGINFAFAKETVKFSKCVDGDTIKILLDNKEYTVRMLAIDTPESVHPTKGIEYYGKEASEYTCQKVTNAKKIQLEYDDDSEKMDKYDRLLAWVFVDENLLQEELITNSYAKIAYLYGDYKYTKQLEKAQEIASAKNIGIWDQEAKEKYDNENNIKTNDDSENNNTDTTTIGATSLNETDNYSTRDIIVIGILLLIIVFVGDKTIKNKAKKKLKKYLG